MSKKLNICRAFHCFLLSPGATCFCRNTEGNEDGFERKPLKEAEERQLLIFRNVNAEKETLALHMKPKVVMLKVSMHCNGCARKIENHISKMQGVTSYRVDLENKMVTMMGDMLPFQVLESVCKLKNAELLDSLLCKK